jgi:uncharacterized protein (TIGR00255 family)
MLLSMTGYGRVTESFQDKIITVEVRSLNSKFTDVRLKVPQNYRDKEPEIRRLISEKAERGKIEFTLEIKSTEGDDQFSLNLPLFRRYYQALRELSRELSMPEGDMMQAILKLPNVVAPEVDFIDEAEWLAVLKIIDLAVEKYHCFRLAEGGAMEEDLRARIAKIQALLHEIDPFAEERIVKFRQRLRQNLEEYLSKERIDENRFEQEMLHYLEKIDITEEKVRLGQHCAYFLEEFDIETTQKGRKLSFISQEIGREINTLGAKAYSSEIQRLVVAMKDELEKIKEQVANLV